MQCSKPNDYSSKYLQDPNYDGTLCHSIQYRSGDKRYMLVGPRMSIGSTIVPGSNGNTLVVPDRRRTASCEVRAGLLFSWHVSLVFIPNSLSLTHTHTLSHTHATTFYVAVSVWVSMVMRLRNYGALRGAEKLYYSLILRVCIVWFVPHILCKKITF